MCINTVTIALERLQLQTEGSMTECFVTGSPLENGEKSAFIFQNTTAHCSELSLIISLQTWI